MPDSSPLNIRRLATSDVDFDSSLAALIEWSALADPAFEENVRDILQSVRQRGDDAVQEYTARFDDRQINSVDELVIDKSSLKLAFDSLESNLKKQLELAADRITRFHERQAQSSWQYRDDSGTLLGQQITALDRVGIYVPGGKAAYPSTVLMNALPAKVAGVPELLMCSPAPAGEINQTVLAAAYLAGVDRVYSIGGAQAIAAMAYGTQIIPRVDKIVGPGNRYVACAKKMVFGEVGLDMVAGPSEILIICDGKTDPDWIAMDLFSQAEHDEDAQSILIAIDEHYLDSVENSINRLLPNMSRQQIIRESLARRGAFILVDSLQEAMDISNRIAPEHLELSVDDAEQWLPVIRHAGAIFLGRHTPEALGDYCAGPNHVLPTSTTARFASPLGVYDFQKRSSIIGCSPSSAIQLSDCAAVLADSEGLTAHASSARYRGGSINDSGANAKGSS